MFPRPRNPDEDLPADFESRRRRLVRDLHIRPLIARCGTEHGSGPGKHRYVVEQTFALLHAFRRLRIHWEIRADIHQAFLSLACALICWRRLNSLIRPPLGRRDSLAAPALVNRYLI
ncbi:hypothetical protein J2S55_008172 [Streptosporangium brasiliense]|uniref:Transposase DDE domain-containing protein n=1 Tax=Streptosporangium brasiliense TaxID=47480 RepID=A0ABT9RHY9_9ACTN|nr:hypothetical protein [Streptosporangium brasiliense]